MTSKTYYDYASDYIRAERHRLGNPDASVPTSANAMMGYALRHDLPEFVDHIKKKAGDSINLNDRPNPDEEDTLWFFVFKHARESLVLSFLQDFTLAKIDQNDDHGQSIFLILTKRNFAKALEFIISTFKNIDLSTADYTGVTPFIWASKMGLTKIQNLILEHFKGKIDIKQTDTLGYSAFTSAVAGDQVEALKILDKAYPGRITDELNKALIARKKSLHLAIYYHSNEIMTYLVKYHKSSLSILETDAQGDNCFKIAARTGNFEVMKLLIDNFGDELRGLAKDGTNSWIFELFEELSEEVAKYIVENNFFDLSVQNSDGQSLCQYAQTKDLKTLLKVFK